MNPVEAKRALRADLRAKVAAITDAERAAASARVRANLATSDAWARAGVVMVFAADASEPDLDGLIELGEGQGKAVCVPRVDWGAKAMAPVRVREAGSLVMGAHGLRVPPEGAEVIPPDEVDLIMAPGVGFDRSGGRVGRGGGFYDRFLAARAGNGTIPVMGPVVVIGACFSCQVVERVPGWTHDRRMDGLVTDAGLWILGGDGGDTEGSG
jgi:5-formyltetrahydrofolate cyclo-ligase